MTNALAPTIAEALDCLSGMIEDWTRRGQTPGSGSADAVAIATAMLELAPTVASGTARKWFSAHDGQTIDTLQFRRSGDRLFPWAPIDRTIDASRSTYVTFSGSMMSYAGNRVIGADDVSLVLQDDESEFLTVYRLSSSRPTLANV